MIREQFLIHSSHLNVVKDIGGLSFRFSDIDIFFSLHEEGIFGGNNSFLSFHNLHLMMKMGFSSIPERERQKVGRNDCFSSCYFILALLKTVSYLCYEERKGCNISPLLDIIIIFVFCGKMDYYQRKNVVMV